MYNGGNSEWQNDYSNLPDYYQTFNRNYDHAIGRFVSMDPQPESAESMTGYQYAGNNPIMMNDPDGAKAAAPGAWKTIENCLAIEEGFSGNMDLGGGGGGGNGGDDGSATTSNGDYTDFWNTVLGAAEDILQSLNSTTDNPSGIQSITFTNSGALLALGDTEGDFNLSFASNGGVVLSPIGGDDSSPSTGTPSMVTTNDGPNNFNDPGGDANQDNRSFLVFESDCVNGKNRVDGRLVWYNQNTDGSVIQAGSYSARSGSKTKNPIPTGDYQLSDYRDRTKDGMVVDGIGFSIDISPDPYLDRSKLRIHPDGGLPGTDGCIGLTGDDNELLDFQQKIQTYLSNHGTMELIVPLQKSLASP
jgi:RHS repeat-associated protein